MISKFATELIMEQSFDHPQTAATETLERAAAAYRDGEMYQSATLFLKGWRVLNVEHSHYLAGTMDRLPPWNMEHYKADDKMISHPHWRAKGKEVLIPETLEKESRARVLMGICALADLALACLGNTGTYKDEDYDWNSIPETRGYHLNVFSLRNIDVGDGLNDGLEFEGTLFQKASQECGKFRRIDEMGWLLQEANNYCMAAEKILRFGLTSSESTLEEHQHYRDTVTKFMKRLLSRAKEKNPVTKSEGGDLLGTLQVQESHVHSSNEPRPTEPNEITSRDKPYSQARRPKIIHIRRLGKPA